MAKECRLTTFDNPFDPFDDFDSWFLFDIEKKYNTCSLVARIFEERLQRNGKDEVEMSQKEIDDEIEMTCDEIILYNPLNCYKKVTRETKENTQDEDE